MLNLLLVKLSFVYFSFVHSLLVHAERGVLIMFMRVVERRIT